MGQNGLVAPNPDRIRSLLSSAEESRLPLEQAASLPPALFNAPEWYDAERARLFHAGWVAVARSSEVAEPNSFVTATIADEPCVVVRRRDGQLAAMSNVCPHRSATIVGQRSGSAPSLLCPYHLWTFDHGGQLRSAPAMDRADGFDVTTICLPRFAVDEWQGFVLVNVDATATPLRESAPQLDALFTEHRIADLVSLGTLECPSPWNWKITVENFLESYHHRGIHPDTLDVKYPGLQSFGVLGGQEPWSGVDHVCTVEGDEPFVALAVYPSLLIAIERGFGMVWFRTEPLAADRTHLTIEAFVLPELGDEPGIGQAVLDGLTAINDEDVIINERTAAGLRSKFARPGRVSHLEASPWHFRRWLLDRIEA